MTVHTMCHNPTVPLEGVNPALLLNFTSRECHMTSQPAEGATMMVCGCQGEHECNDKLIFDQGANGEWVSEGESGGMDEYIPVSSLPLQDLLSCRVKM